MANLVGRVVKLAGSGIGLGREAYLHHKDKKNVAQRGVSPNLRPGEQANRPRSPYADDDIYVQLPEADAEELITNGQAYPVPDEKQRELKRFDYDDESDSDEAVDLEDDWEADEEADLPPPSYDSLYSVDSQESADSKGKQAPSYVRDAPQSSTEAPESSGQSEKQAVKLVRQVMAQAGPIPNQRMPLEYPVLIPQRRPGAKTRGFVRGYAPDLAASGISQDTFMRFLHNFDEASKASPYLQALFISAGIVGLVPGVITMAVSISVQVATGIAKELDSRYRANAYLDEINRQLFMPRGLYAMVMRYKPQAQLPGDQMDLGFGEVNMETAKNVARWAPGGPNESSGPPSSGMRVIQKIRLASGTARRAADMPTTCAPLIFPTADGGARLERTLEPTDPAVGLPSASGERTFKEKAKSAYEFVNDYYDRRAQAGYLQANPGTALGNQTAAPEFRSRYADPNNTTNSNVFSLLTGNASNRPGRAERKTARRERRNQRRVARGREPRLPPGQREPRGPVGYLRKGVKKVLHEDVLYLMVVELPSQQELAEARQVLLANGWTK